MKKTLLTLGLALWFATPTLALAQLLPTTCPTVPCTGTQTCNYVTGACEDPACPTPCANGCIAGTTECAPAATASPSGAPPAGGDTPVPPVSEVLETGSPIGPGGQVDRGNVSPVIKGISSIRGLTGAILIFVLSFVGVVALLVIVYAGFRYVTAFGESTEKFKSMITAAIVGIVIIMGAWALVTTVLNLGGGFNIPL